MITPRLSDEVIEHFRQIYDESAGLQWITGDYLADVVDELSPMFASQMDGEYNQAVTRARASIIRQLAYSVGCDTTTLRDRESMSRFYPQVVREDYHMLSYHQLRACKSAGENWQQWADWARDNLPAPVALLRKKIKANGHEEPAYISRWQRLIILAEAIRDDVAAPGRMRKVCAEVLRSGVRLE